MEFVTDTIKYLTSILELIGPWAYGLIFVVAFADSIIILGSFAAGSAFLFIAGLLLVHGPFQFMAVMFFGAAGAVLGGFLNYHLGAAGTGFLAQRAQEKKEQGIVRGESLLEKYGGFGIVIGRFFGPISSIIAFSAGLSGMSQKKFLLWNIATGLVWSTTYVFLGAVFGNSFTYFDQFMA